MMHRPLVIVRSPEAVKTILVTGEKNLFQMAHMFSFHHIFGERSGNRILTFMALPFSYVAHACDI